MKPIAALCVLLLASCAPAAQERFIAPLGALDFCDREPGDALCQDRTDLVRLARLVKAQLWERFDGADDITRIGVAEQWAGLEERDGRLTGDCEDHAIEAHRMLSALGWSADRMRLATAFTEHGNSHAVLLLTVPGQDTLAIDNRVEHVVPARRLPYTRWRVQQAGMPVSAPWVSWAP